VNARFDGVVLRGQAERVVADREEHVIALEAALAADDVHRRERPRVADMQPLPGRVGEFDQAVELLFRVILDRLEAMRVRPFALPFELDRVVVVPVGHSYLHFGAV